MKAFTRQDLVRYERGGMNDTEVKEIEAAVKARPDLRRQLINVRKEMLFEQMDDKATESIEPSPAAVAFVERLWKRDKASEWWTFVPNSPDELANLNATASKAGGRIYRSVVEDDGFRHERFFTAEVVVTESEPLTFRFESSDWPADYVLHSVLLVDFQPLDRQVAEAELDLPPRLRQKIVERRRAMRAPMTSESCLPLGARTAGRRDKPTEGEFISSNDKRTKAIYTAFSDNLSVETFVVDGCECDAIIAETEFTTIGGRREVRRRAVELQYYSSRKGWSGETQNLDYPDDIEAESFRLRLRSAAPNDLHLLNPETREEFLSTLSPIALHGVGHPSELRFRARWKVQLAAIEDSAMTWFVQTEKES